MKRILLSIFILVLATTSLFATHNRAGEITYEQISQFYYKVIITTYTKTSSPADRPSLDLFWGDGTFSTLPRASFQDNFGGPGSDIRKNTYFGFHTYPGPSVYKLYFEDPNRNGGVVNIPNSINVPFYVESELIISAFLGFNNSPVLLQPPIDEGVEGQVFIHNPNAYDPDGDSLSYQLIFCKGANGLAIPGYAYPTANNSFTLDAVTGDLVWNTPQDCGEFNVAFLIKEWRNGVMIGYVERDMQIDIVCSNQNQNNNTPPIIANITDICVTAGDTINFDVTATDSPTNLVTLTATGAPLDLTFLPATFNQPFAGTGSVTGNFNWITDCAHVRNQPYSMVFKAEDNDAFVNLVDLESVRITVVAPAPLNPTAVPMGNTIQVGWDQSICSQAIGYKIYRRTGFYGYMHGPCETGVPAYTGYVKIATLTGIGTLSYIDNNNNQGLAAGTDYCYMIIAYFSDGAESYASAEVCTTLKKEFPVITNVSVAATNTATGSMNIAWSAPSDLDIAQFPAPHEYHILRATGLNGSNFSLAGINTGGLVDTLFTDNNINTVDNGYTYKIELYATISGSLQLVGPSEKASSIYLSISPTDKKLNLSWNLNVPWQNNYFAVFRYNGATFDSIGFTTTTAYSDSGLVNGQQYCYYIKSSGNYLTSGFVDPIINLSQEVCAIPLDNVPPCAINSDTANFDCIARQITLSWNIPDSLCADDVASYNIYYTSTPDGTYSLLASVNNPGINSFSYTSPVSIAGCYYITAVDSTGNEGTPGNVICVDNCPVYELPNVFTPDGNNLNDTFHPFPYRYVQSIDIKIFSRWGLMVFSSTDPDIKWNGKTDNTGKDLPEGVYYYTCVVNEIYLSGIKSRELKGVIQLLRNNGKINN